MSKKLYFVVSLVLVFALAVSTSAEEKTTLLASYERTEAAAHCLTAKVNDESANATEIVVWPMVQGKDAYSFDPNFGQGVKVPAATDGNCVLGLVWKNEEDGRVDIHHEWSPATFDLTNVDKILIDVYIVGPNGIPSTIELWDQDMAWLLGYHDTIVPGKWFTVTFDLAELQETGRRNAAQSQITTIYFSGVATKDGKAFFDNLRLEGAAAPKPAAPASAEETKDVNAGAKKP